MEQELNEEKEWLLELVQMRKRQIENPEPNSAWNNFAKEKTESYIQKSQKKIKRLEYLLKVERGEIKTSADSITDEMIEAAKQFPIRDLIHSTNDVVTKCPFHNDKTASMNIKNNFAYCHGCGWTGDTIKIYQTIHSTTFPEAVKYLSRM